MNFSENQYRYYAFISYSRKNTKAAAYLHKQLEHFRIPVKYVAEENRPRGKFLRPVFRDRRDLETGENNFSDNIKLAIEQSRYLLVLCSPEAAASHWVQEEIKHFLATHNNDYGAIVPVILSGEPGTGNAAECLPEILRRKKITMRNLPSMLPDDGEPEKTGWENGTVQVLSYMLKVHREKIKATVDAEKVRQAKIYAVIGIIATVIFALLTAWALYAQRQANMQANIAQKSLEFLQGVFQSSDPTQKGNKDMKVLDAINAKLPEIATLEPWQLKASVASTIGNIFSRLGEYDKAMNLLQQAFELNQKYRPISVDTAVSYNNIGLVYADKGDYDNALVHYNKARVIQEQKSGKDHPNTASSYNNIGLVYAQKGDYDNALVYYNKALVSQEKTLGKDHPDTARSYNNIGLVYADKGDYDNALLYYNKALVIKEQKLGKDHPDTATSYGNIGSVYLDKGDYDNAVVYLNKALVIQEQKLGKNHPDTANSYNNIGNVYQAKGDYDKALEFHNKALVIQEKTLGENHPNTAMSYGNIGNVYWNKGDYDNALLYYNKTLKIFEQKSGKDHPYTAMSYNNIGLVYWNKDDYDNALVYYNKALVIREKTLGENHPATATSYNNIGAVYAQKGDYENALVYLNKARVIYEQTLGKDHEYTRKTTELIEQIRQQLNNQAEKNHE